MFIIAMHIPNGFLGGGVAAALWLLAIVAVANGLRVANAELDKSRVPLLGVLAAFIFAVQMLNFPVAGGTSGHLLGATLAAVLLGPWIACLVMAVVLTVQCFAFADGASARSGERREHGRPWRPAGRLPDQGPDPAATQDARGVRLGRRHGVARGHDRGDRHGARAGDVGHRAARHRTPGDARVHALIGIGEAVIRWPR